MIELAHGAAKDIAFETHGFDPGIFVDVESVQYRRKGVVDGTSLVGSNRAAGPVNEV